MIGSRVAVAGSENGAPAVAYGGGHYLLVWERRYGVNDIDVLACRVIGSGPLAGTPGPVWTLYDGSSCGKRPRVAAVGGPGGETTGAALSLGLGLTVLAAIGQIDFNMRSIISDQLPEDAYALLMSGTVLR